MKIFKINTNNQCGIALLMVLSVTAMLITVTLEMNKKIRTTVMASAQTRDRLVLSEIAGAGIQAGMAMLNKDRKENKIDSIQEDWASPEKIAAVLEEMPFEDGNLNVSISDELGRIQINALVDFPKGRSFNEPQKIMWDRFTRLLIDQIKNQEEADLSPDVFEDLQATTIINCVKDWLDSGDDDATTGLDGAESDYYKDLDPPYQCANSPFTHLQQLKLVKGMVPELFEGLGEMGGISEYMTVFGADVAKKEENGRKFSFSGKININTADLPVLMAMVPSEDPEISRKIFEYRQEQDESGFTNSLTSPTWYKTALEDYVDEKFQIDKNLIEIKSDFFRIEASASLNNNAVTTIAVVKREKLKKTGKWSCRVLSWQTNG